MARNLLARLLLLTAACSGCTSIPDGAMTDQKPEPGRASPLVRSLDEDQEQAHPPLEPTIEPEAYCLNDLLVLVDLSPALQAAQEAIARETGTVVQGDFIPNPVLRFESEFMPIDDMGFGNAINKVRVIQRIETAGKADARVKAAIARRDTAKAFYFHLRAQAQADMAKEFYRTLFNAQKIASIRRMLEQKTGLHGLAKALNTQGRLSDLDLIAHEVAVEKTRAALRTLEAEERRLLRAIEGRLGLSAGTITACTGQVPKWSSPDPEAAREVLLMKNPELILLDRKVDAAYAGKDAAGTLAYPDITVSLGYARGSEFGREHKDFLLGFIEVPFPVIDRNQGGILSAEAAVREAESELEAAAYRVLDQWQGSLERRRILGQKRDLYYERIIPLLEKGLDLKKAQGQAGRRSIQSSLEAAVALEDAVVSALDMDETLALIMVEMRYLVGGELGS